jgi:DNA-binding transcriptional LysR family regulator
MTAHMPWFIRARLKTRQLMLLVAIDEARNIHRAAEALSMSQPAASKLLKDLEDMLGVSLFERLPREMRPNWYGEAMIRHARIALASLREAGEEVAALKAGRFGQVSLGAITGPALSLLPDAMATVAREHPSLRIQLTIESSDVLLERLVQGRLDIMIGRLFENQDKAGLRYERLTVEHICAVVRPNHPMLGVNALTLQELAQAAWIVPPTGSVLRHRFELMFHEAGLAPPTQIIETAALLFVTKMLQQSDFISVVPTDVARYYGQYGMLAILPIQLSCSMDSFGIITRTGWLLSPAARIVLRALRMAAVSNYGIRLNIEEPC